MLTVQWVQPRFGEWYRLDNDFSRVIVTGVYLIWHLAGAGQPGRYVKVGQGKNGSVGERLSAHKSDPAILAYGRFADLRVTWASVPTDRVDGVERHLGDNLRPLIGDRFPDVTPIAVNLPA
jgi:hypothetical protein